MVIATEQLDFNLTSSRCKELSERAFPAINRSDIPHPLLFLRFYEYFKVLDLFLMEFTPP